MFYHGLDLDNDPYFPYYDDDFDWIRNFDDDFSDEMPDDLSDYGQLSDYEELRRYGV